MNTLYQRSRAAAVSEQETDFKASIQALSKAVVSIVQLLSQSPEKVSASALGTRLAILLTCIRQHRNHAVALGPIMDEPGELVTYLDKLRLLRTSVAQWLTIHAAQPKLIYVELADFEAQCWSTLGLGVVLLDGVNHEDLYLLTAPYPAAFINGGISLIRAQQNLLAELIHARQAAPP